MLNDGSFLISSSPIVSSGKPENDLGLKMVQVCIKENGPGFQNIEIDRKMV